MQKKKPRRTKPKSDALEHEVRKPADIDVEKLASSLQDMPRRLVRRKLRGYGVNPDQAVKRIKATIDNALETLRRGHHQTKTLNTATAGHPVLEWSSTQFIADGLRSAESPAARLAVISDGFEHLGVEADALRIHCAGPDAVWPLIECVYEAAIVVARVPELWKSLAAAHAHLASRLSPVHQCMLVHNVHELRDGDLAPPAFVAALGEGLSLATMSSEARVLLARHSRVPRESVTDPVALLTNPDADPLACFFAMYSLDASDAAGVEVLDELIDSLRDHSASHFFTIGALARFNQRHPSRAVSKMARAAESASDNGRYALFLAMIRGYEQSFRGRRQEVVPRFDLTASPHFIPGNPHDLDRFGELVCRSGVASELHPQMRWANRRFALWLSHSH